MSSPDRGLLRALRAAAVVLCVVGVSLVGHVAAGGDVPGPLTLIVSAVVVAGYAGALTRNRLGPGELIGVLGSGQLLLHTAFMTSGGSHAGGLAMFAGHAIAGVVLALALARGEDAVWALWCWLRPRFAVPEPEYDAPSERVDSLAATAAARAGLTWIGTSVSWRGPPPPTSQPR